MKYVKIGTIIGTHGLDGKLRIFSTTYFAALRFKVGNLIYIKNDEQFIPMIVSTYNNSGKTDILGLEEIKDEVSAKQYIKKDLFCEKDSSLQKKGLYYFSDLMGCKVMDNSNNQTLGQVVQVEEFPAQITLRVRKNNGGDFFVPFVKEFIISVDIENKAISIKVIEGML